MPVRRSVSGENFISEQDKYIVFVHQQTKQNKKWARNFLFKAKYEYYTAAVAAYAICDKQMIFNWSNFHSDTSKVLRST